MIPTSQNLPADYDRLAGFLRGISSRLQILAVLDFLVSLASFSILILLGGFFVEEWKKNFPYLPWLYSLSALAGLASFLTLSLRHAIPWPSPERLAKQLENRYPQLHDDLTNSLHLFQQVKKGPAIDRVSHSLISAHLRKTAEEVLPLARQPVVSFQGVWKKFRLLAPLALIFFVVISLDPNFLPRSLALILHPGAALPAKKTLISLEPGESTVLRGQPVEISARTTGEVPDRLFLILWPEKGKEVRLEMESAGKGKFIYRIPSARFSFRYQATANRSLSSIYAIQVADPPAVGKIQVTLWPPDYTRLPREVKEEGNIEALKGTVANLEIQATKSVTAASLIFNELNRFPLEVQGNRLHGTLWAYFPGTYSIRIKDQQGFENPNPVHYQLRVIPDQFPKCEILIPETDLEITGDETLVLRYKAEDDFGITAARLHYQVAGINRAFPLALGKEGRFIGPETFNWDLTSLTLMPGDRVKVHLEVRDNDTVSGPKVGLSRAFTLFVKNERALAAREGEEAQRIADALLDLLADQLEDKKDPGKLAQEMAKILLRVDKNLAQMGSRLDRPDWEVLKRNLASLRERMGRESEETVTQEMERLSLLAEEIAKRARMNAIEAAAREMKNRQRRLIDYLKDLKDSASPDQLDKIMKELAKLEDLLRSVMESLSQLAAKLPDEFINSPELQGLQFQDLFQGLEEIKKMLMAGDMQGALAAAQKFLQALSQMMAALGRAGAQASMASLEKFQGEMNRQASEMDKILAEQGEILRETEGTDRRMKKKSQEKLGAELERSRPALQGSLQDFAQSLEPEQRDLVRELSSLLEKGGLEKFFDLLNRADREWPNRGAREAIGKIREEIETLRRRAQASPGPEEKKKFPVLSDRQDKLKGRTEAIQETLERLAQIFPGLDTEILQDLRGAARSMGEASGQLKAEDAPAAIPPEQDVIRRLTRSQQSMMQMAQQMAMRMQSARWGYPLAYDPRAGWYYGPWVPMPTLPQPEPNRPREPGYTGIDREEFEPPSKDSYQVPRIFRERVQDALKEDIPSSYKGEVEKYFRGLAE